MPAVLTHRSPFAGSWYPSDASELRQVLASALENSTKRTGPFVRRGGFAFIVPHAAPYYSGTVAASAYRHVRESGASRVILLGFCHRRSISGIAVPVVDLIETPLGAVRIDREAAESLAASPPFYPVAEQITCDHSVEIQIPFLQTLSPTAMIVPLYVGALSDEQMKSASAVLRSLIRENSVLIASSDLTHFGRGFGYYPFDVDESIADNLRALDMGVLDAASSLDPAVFGSEIERTGATVCGTGPIRLLLETLRGLEGDTFQEILDYDTSGAMTGDFEHSVSYGAVGYFPAEAFHLEREDQAELLSSARFTLDHYRRTGERRFLQKASRPALLQHGRAFVTLYAGGDVKGCVGHFDNPMPLANCIPQLAIASSDDGRFGFVAPDEELEIEVHILTPPRKIVDPLTLEAGKHGAILRSGIRRGLLLPSVAKRYGLSTREFLRELTRKAGVPQNIYSQTGWELSVFCDQSFSETQ